MSKIEELIKEKCPNGVEYKRLKSVCTEVIVPMRDRPKIFDGEIPWCRIEDIEGKYFNDSLSGLKVSEEVIKEMNLKVFPTGTVICSCSASIGVYAINTQPLITNQTFIGLVCGDEIFNKFLLYYMETQTKTLLKLATTGTIPYISRNKFEDLEIPVPPIEVQQEIVRILDKFTELEAELQAELAARKKQYEYYLAQFISNNLKYEIRTLGEIGVVRMCKRVLKDQTDVNGEIPFFKIGTFGGVPDAYISRELFEEYKEKYNYPKKGHVLISASGTIGRTVVFDGEPAYFQDSNIVWLEHDSTQVIDEYLEYVYKTNPWKISAGGTIARLYNDNIVNALIPVPSIADQKKIVKILGKYKEICEDTQTGLPAEIAARHKQYEYYRDKLLTFKRKEV